MLSPAHRAIVSATVPLLEQGGEALTRHFYQILFAEHPQVQALFNQAHQHSGDQQRALAGAILAYARNIERLEALGPAVATIVQKHVALQILPEHYPLVGASLLKAIREVLGAQTATDAVLEAWGAAYGQLARILIGAEAAAYDASAAASGGWRGARRFTVLEKVVESAEITSLRLVPEDGQPVLAFAPGQYIGLQVDVAGTPQRRQYSLSAASNGRDYRISVKREAGGKVSGYLHDTLAAGGVLELFPPAGAFTLAGGSRPVLLISGGVGITPTLAMLEQALESGRQVHFIHAARDPAVHAFRQQVDALAAQHPQLQRYYCYAEAPPQQPGHVAIGLLDQQRLAHWLPANRDVDAYFLGPPAFMRVVKRALHALGVPPAQTHHEFFGPAAALD